MLAAITLALFAAAIYFGKVKHSYFPTYICGLLTVISLFGTIMFNTFFAGSAQAQQEYTALYNDNAHKSIVSRYQQGVATLQKYSVTNIDKDAIDIAAKNLSYFQHDSEAEAYSSECPDAKVLYIYANALAKIATYSNHLNNDGITSDEELLTCVSEIPENYSGTLADKIMPLRRTVLAKKAQADKEAKLAQENAAKYAKNLAEGKQGKIKKGDPEDDVTAAFGKPTNVYVSGTDNDELKQYVFKKDGRTIYVYTKNGVVTGVSK